MIADRVALSPTTLDEALELRAAHPELSVVAGGTDAMVGVNAGRGDLVGWLSLRRVEELRSITHDESTVSIGAATTMQSIVTGLAARLPALADAARTVGGPQIRAMATIGGNVTTGSPAGDTLTPLVCLGAEVELRSVAGTRRLPLREFLLGPKRTALRADELLVAVHVPDRGPRQVFAKAGPRGAMVIAVCNIAVVLHADGAGGNVAVGSAGPTIVEAGDAVGHLLDPDGADAFAAAVSAATRPIDDVRGTAAYRRHAVHVLARRAHRWVRDG